MTNEEAIGRIRDHMDHHGIGHYPHLKIKEALDLAISALQSVGKDITAPTKNDHFRDFTKMVPLTLEQLREMDGEPVWVQTPGIPQYGRWVIVAGVDTEYGQRTLYCQGDYTCRNYGRVWIAYRRKPEGEEDTLA